MSKQHLMLPCPCQAQHQPSFFLHMQRVHLQTLMCSTEQGGARLPILFPCWVARLSPLTLCHVEWLSAQGSSALISR